MKRLIKLLFIAIAFIFVITNVSNNVEAVQTEEDALSSSFSAGQTKTSLVVDYKDLTKETETVSEKKEISFINGGSAETLTTNNNDIVSDVVFVESCYPDYAPSNGLKLGSSKKLGVLDILFKNGLNTSYIDFNLLPWGDYSSAEFNIEVTYIDQTKTTKIFTAQNADIYRLTTEIKEIDKVTVATTSNGIRGYLKGISFDTAVSSGYDYLATKLKFVSEFTFDESIINSTDYSYGILYSEKELDLNSYTVGNINNINSVNLTYSNSVTPTASNGKISLEYTFDVTDFTKLYYSSFYFTSDSSIYFMNKTSNGVSLITKTYIEDIDAFKENEVKILNDINVVNSLENLKTGTITVDPVDPYDPTDPSTVDLSEYVASNLPGNLREDLDFNVNCIDSTEEARVLVIPVSFGGEGTSSYHDDNDISRIKTAFNGTAEETGWNSVSSFYETSSYGKENLTIDVLDDWVYLDNSISYYENISSYDYTGDNIVLQEVTNELDSTVDFSKYDADNNGTADAIWLIYDYGDVNDYDFLDEHGDLFWAYITWNGISSIKHDGVSFDTYGWAGMHFMDSTPQNGYLNIDAHTYAHETGHMFGLDDYYDYYDYNNSDPQMYGTMYGADLMDYTIGDHNPYSKFILGWVDPMVITKTTKVTIRNFEETGECLLVSLSTPDSKYGDYFFIDLYTNTGLNAYDEPVNNNSAGLNYGIRVIHGHSEIGYNSTEDGYNSGFQHDNSGFDSAHQLDFLTSDGPHKNTYTDDLIDTDDLFQMNSSKSFYEVYGSDYSNNQKILGGTDLYFDIEINSMDVNSATLTIKFI